MTPIHGPEIGPLVFAIGASQPFGERICADLGIEPAPIEERTFEDGEHKLRPLMNVRNRDVYVVHSLNGDAEAEPQRQARASALLYRHAEGRRRRRA